MVWQSIQVSFLAMGVIFLVLSVLIGVIKILDKLIPYKAPPPAPPKPSSARPKQQTSTLEEEEHLAAIQATLAFHLGKQPQQIQISNIQAR